MEGPTEYELQHETREAHTRAAMERWRKSLDQDSHDVEHAAASDMHDALADWLASAELRDGEAADQPPPRVLVRLMRWTNMYTRAEHDDRDITRIALWEPPRGWMVAAVAIGGKGLPPWEE